MSEPFFFGWLPRIVDNEELRNEMLSRGSVKWVKGA